MILQMCDNILFLNRDPSRVFCEGFCNTGGDPTDLTRQSALAVPRAKLNEAMHLPGGMVGWWMYPPENLTYPYIIIYPLEKR